MFCPYCGKKISDDSRFCGACGANLIEFSKQYVDETSENVNSKFQEPNNDHQSGFVQSKKKKMNAKLISIAAVILIVIIAAVIIKNFILSGSGESNAYVYLSDGKYELITNLKKDEIIEIASSKSDSALYTLLSFSPDGKYIYYYTKVDTSSYAGTLCRAEYGRLKENSSKNDNYIEVIASNVSLGFTFLDDGSLLYKKEDGALYYYDGNGPVQIAKSITNYYCDEYNRVIYEIKDDDGDNVLYGISLNNINSRIKFASNYTSIYVTYDFNNIFFTRKEDGNNENLYVVGFNTIREKIGSNVSDLIVTDDGTVCFTAENGKTLNLYDYVIDSYASEDAIITEPDIDDYGVPTYSYNMIYGWNLSESDYDELYTSCTNKLYMYGESRAQCYSMEEAVSRNWGDNTDEFVKATQGFIDKFADQADENGYILVTEEVKNALKTISQSSDSEKDWAWLWLCYSKEQTGASYNYDAYNSDCDIYYEAEERITMRKALKDEENAYALNTLYRYENGALKVIAENVLSTEFYSDAILFNTSEMIENTIRIENLSSISDVTALFDINPEARNYLVSTSGSRVYQMTQNASDEFSEACADNYASLRIVEGNIYMSGGDGGLYVAEISGDEIRNFSIIADDAEIYSVSTSTVYYISGEYEYDGCRYGDLYSYSGGMSTLLAQDILVDSNSFCCILYNDGSILANTDYTSGYGYELTMFDSYASKTIIAEDVTQYIRVSKSTLLYISDGDLYLYDGKEKTHIRNDVDCVWSRDTMEISEVFGFYDYTLSLDKYQSMLKNFVSFLYD